jgi:hypothetical protein
VKTFSASLDSGEWEGVENFDFAWLEKVGPDQDTTPLYINLNPSPGQIKHSFPPVDRCCKLPPPGFTFDGIDEVSISAFRYFLNLETSLYMAVW